MVKFKNLHISEKSHAQLQHISKLTNVPMAKIVEQITDCMICLVAGDYPKATFKVMDMVTEDSVIITIHTYGKPNLVFGKSSSDAEMFEVSKRLLEKSEAENQEVFGDGSE